MDDLDGVLACFYEALRMFRMCFSVARKTLSHTLSQHAAAGYMLVRRASRNTTLDLPHRENPKKVERILVNSGETIHLDTVGIGVSADFVLEKQLKLMSTQATIPTPSLIRIRSNPSVGLMPVGMPVCPPQKRAMYALSAQETGSSIQTCSPRALLKASLASRWVRVHASAQNSRVSKLSHS